MGPSKLPKIAWVGPNLSGPVLRDTARLSQRYPPVARYGVSGVSTWPIGCDTPSPFSERFPPWRACEVEVRYPSLKRGISAILVRYPLKTRQMVAIPPSAILSRKGIARFGGVSRIGPLRAQLVTQKRLGVCTPKLDIPLHSPQKRRWAANPPIWAANPAEPLPCLAYPERISLVSFCGDFVYVILWCMLERGVRECLFI